MALPQIRTDRHEAVPFKGAEIWSLVRSEHSLLPGPSEVSKNDLIFIQEAPSLTRGKQGGSRS